MSTPAPPHAERLRVPVGWWLLGGAVVLPVAAALGIYLGWWQVVGFTLVALVGLAGSLLWFGSARVETGEHALRAGDYAVEWEYVGTATPLDARATRERLGARADAAAALVMRPYIPTAVEVEIVDPADPHPYWLISTRRPTALARAVNARAAHAREEAA